MIAAETDTVDARRFGQAERHDSLAARNTRLAPGELIACASGVLAEADGVVAYKNFQVPYRKWMRVLDASHLD